MKSLQYTGFNTFAEIITDMAKKMLFLWVVQGGQEWPERQEAAIQMQRIAVVSFYVVHGATSHKSSRTILSASTPCRLGR